MTLTELLDWLIKAKDCSGTVSLVRDEMWGVHVGAEQEHGYVARTTIGGATYAGRGLSPEEAIGKLGEKLKAKF